MHPLIYQYFIQIKLFAFLYVNTKDKARDNYDKVSSESDLNELIF